MKIIQITALISAAALTSSCCLPIPWSAWRYETEQYTQFPSPHILPSIKTHSGLYVKDVFIFVWLRAHNETTNSGKSPFQIFVNATATTPTQREVTFHSVSVTDGEGLTQTFSPITTNSKGEKTSSIPFPVSMELESIQYYAEPSKIKGKNRKRATLRSDTTFSLAPKNKSNLAVTIDVEVTEDERSERKNVVYEFRPVKESGIWQCITA